jgi:hypothetical protein
MFPLDLKPLGICLQTTTTIIIIITSQDNHPSNQLLVSNKLNR